MADSIHIEVRGINAVLAGLKPEAAERGIKSGLAKAAVLVKGRVSKYPPGARAHRPQPFVSDRQRRYFFWALNNGEIEVPYQRGISPRSERHGQSWTTAERDGGLSRVIGSDTSYGKLLQDEAEQSAYHAKTGWKTTATVADESNEDVVELVNDDMWMALTGGA